MNRPTFKLTTLIALHALAALLVWLNVSEAVTGTNQYIIPLGWPNDALCLYQEHYHALRAGSGLAPEWGFVVWNGLAANALLAASALGCLYLALEWTSLKLPFPQPNTRWMLLGVFAVLLAVNICKRSDTFANDFSSSTPGYGAPFVAYSHDRWMLSLLSNDPSDHESEFFRFNGWHLSNLAANLCAAGWILFACYVLCERKWARGNAAQAPSATAVAPQ